MSRSPSHAYLSCNIVERIVGKAVPKLDPASQQFHVNQIVSPPDFSFTRSPIHYRYTGIPTFLMYEGLNAQ